VVIQPGQIWWADLGTPRGSSPGYKRPVVVLQSDVFNRTKIGTIIVAIVTSNFRLAEMPGNVFVSKDESGLDMDSVVNVTQLFTVDKNDLFDFRGRLGSGKLREVRDGLRLVLEL
jgi:mRNA interferase MazF